MKWLMAIAVLLAGCQATVPATPTRTPVPRAAGVPAVDAVLSAFADHQVVAIGEYHGSAAEHEFLRELLANPRFIGLVDDVAVEFGSARHQTTIDRFVRGESVSEAELSRVWADTTQQSGVWDDPVYRQFFEAVRTVNAGGRDDGGVRVLLGDPPIAWDAITASADCDDSDPACLDYWILRRDQHFASVVEASLTEGRRVLVIAGAGHVLRNPDVPEARSLVDLLDAAHPAQTWTLVPPNPAALDSLQAYLEPMAGATARAVPLVDGPLAEVNADPVFHSGTVTCDPAPCPSEAPSTVTLGDVADALLLL